MALCSVGLTALLMMGSMALVARAVFARRYAFAGGCSRFGGHGHGHGHGHWHGRWSGGGFGTGRHPFLRMLFRRLDTTPGQEREIRTALEELRAVARSSRHATWSAREGLGRAVSGEAFDAGAFDEVTAAAFAEAQRVKEAMQRALEKVHGVLDESQRKTLGELLARGRGKSGGPAPGGGGPYRE